ncbi:violaceus kinesin [Aspergillus steynii IBT 23096]|uniref:Violaceus kinesin n=1 Tax=Aspergillus steynii IBT 23096 TaxID=1392250 RepID=A0A2I2G164_9EURO|nr:violaceus kinesin [Aspergillus steynii IBT 23096]PLB46624.1 violaceus kinesin [Aspergillus steynii IBT 23096]
MSSPARSHASYTVAWICALPLEMTAAKVMLDETHDPLPQQSTDHNIYTLGSISGHNVVVVCLPSGVYGTTSASTVVSHLITTFPYVQFGLMVGIGGGVPSPSADIRLGDIVVSKPTPASSGVVQYDYGKALRDGQFQRTGQLNKPPPILLKAMTQMESDYMMGRKRVGEILAQSLGENEALRERFARPQNDWLFQATYDHDGQSCLECDYTQLVSRPERITDEPYVHYGLIASGNQVMKDANTRDVIARDLDILCFEMEAAGLMDELPSLIIRGISDYCDSHKNKEWQGYAAFAAATYAKVLLLTVPNNHRKDVHEPHRPQEQLWVVPFGQNSRFVGRGEEIGRIEALLTQPSGSSNIAVCGLGGVGKTQIALELAYRMRNRDPQWSIFWIPCTGYESVEQAYISIAQKVGIEVKAAEVKSQVKAYFSQRSAGNWLLIFDNADDMEMWIDGTSTNPALKQYLPQSDRGHIVFTTRSRKLAVKLASKLSSDQSATLKLLEQLACLPLAISQAAAYINENDIGISDYLELLEAQESDVIELLSEEFEDEGRYTDTQNPIATTWLISFQQIQRLDQVAAEYLAFMACIDPRDIPQSLLPDSFSRGSITKKKRIDAIGLLKGYSFVNEQAGHDFLSLHRLVHLATRNWLRINQKFGEQITKTADRLMEVFPNNNNENRALWREYLPHALSLIYEKEFGLQRRHYIPLIQTVCECLDKDGRYNEAALMCDAVVGLKLEKAGEEDPSTLQSMGLLANIYSRQGRWKEAEHLFERVIDIRKRVVGPEDPSTLRTMNNLAAAYRKQGRKKEAEELGKRVVQLQTQLLGPTNLQTLVSMNSLAMNYINDRRWNEAEELAAHVMAHRMRILGPEHPDTLISMGNLATVLSNLGQLEQSQQLALGVLQMHQLSLGPEHPHTLISMSNVARLWRKMGKLEAAVDLMTECLKLREKVFGAGHPRALSSRKSLEDWKMELEQGWDVVESDTEMNK